MHDGGGLKGYCNLKVMASLYDRWGLTFGTPTSPEKEQAVAPSQSLPAPRHPNHPSMQRIAAGSIHLPETALFPCTACGRMTLYRETEGAATLMP